MSVVILVTTETKEEAEKISQKLLKEKLIACANIIENVESHFRWKSKIDQANEVLMILKTQNECIDEVITTVKKHHSYEVPEIIALPILEGNEDYLNWIKESTD